MPTILIVDDEHDLLTAFGAVLRHEGYRVRTAATPDQALQVLASERPGPVVMDIAMPRMNGIQATVSIHADCPGVRVIGLARDQCAEKVQALLDAGAIACVSSYAALDTLLTTLVRCPTATHSSDSQR